MTWHLVCSTCVRLTGPREIKSIGVMRAHPCACAVCGVELPPAFANGARRPWATGAPVNDSDLAELRAAFY